MKNELFKRIVIISVICFFIMTSLSPAQKVSEVQETEVFSQYNLINKIGSDEVIIGEKLDLSYYGPEFIEHMDDCIARDKEIRSNNNAIKKMELIILPRINVNSQRNIRKT